MTCIVDGHCVVRSDPKAKRCDHTIQTVHRISTDGYGDGSEGRDVGNASSIAIQAFFFRLFRADSVVPVSFQISEVFDIDIASDVLT